MGLSLPCSVGSASIAQRERGRWSSIACADDDAKVHSYSRSLSLTEADRLRPVSATIHAGKNACEDVPCTMTKGKRR